MAKVGFSPPTRVFEAAGAGACVITDAWEGIEQFFTPGAEILCARSAEEVVKHLQQLWAVEAAKVGCAMRRRALAEHTYESRARAVHSTLQALFSKENNYELEPDSLAVKLSQVPA